jgi:hypothetical protein
VVLAMPSLRQDTVAVVKRSNRKLNSASIMICLRMVLVYACDEINRANVTIILKKGKENNANIFAL